MAYKRLGDVLIDAGLITEDQLGHALKQQKETKRRLGDELIAEGVITEAAGEEAVSSLGVSLGETMVAVKKTFFAGDRFSMYCIDHFPKEQLTREQAVLTA